MLNCGPTPLVAAPVPCGNMVCMSNGWNLSFCVQMANNLEGGKSPQLRPEVLQDLGFKLVAYPLLLLGVSVRAMQIALQGLAQGQPPPPSAMPSFQVIFADMLYKYVVSRVRCYYFCKIWGLKAVREKSMSLSHHYLP